VIISPYVRDGPHKELGDRHSVGHRRLMPC
jgi:hypothetical protein